MHRLAKYTIALLAVALLAWPDWSHAGDNGLTNHPTPGVIIIADDNGGNVEDHLKFYQRIHAAALPLRIEGDCISACTLALGMFTSSEICMTDKGSFGFHMAAVDGIPNRRLTNRLVHRWYPAKVQQWIKRHAPLTPEVQFMYADEAKELGLVVACPSLEASHVAE